MKRSAAVLLPVLLSTMLLGSCSSRTSSPPPGKLYEPARKYSYDPPPGWEIRDISGGQSTVANSKIACGKAVDGVQPTITVTNGAYDGGIEQQVDVHHKWMDRMGSEVTVRSRTPFTTDFGVPGIRVDTTVRQTLRASRQIEYFFGPETQYYVATCTIPPMDGNAHDAAFDAAMKTFRLHP
jgi:hypothetical protein